MSVVDDGSADGTVAERRDLPFDLLRHAVNPGQGAAPQTGCECARQRGAEIVVSFEADGQHEPQDICTLVQTWRAQALYFLSVTILPIRYNRVQSMFLTVPEGVLAPLPSAGQTPKILSPISTLAYGIPALVSV